MLTVPGDLYHSKHAQGQAIEAWRHSLSHKLGGNVLFPAIATSPDRTRYPWHVVANYALSAVIATSPDSILAQI